MAILALATVAGQQPAPQTPVFKSSVDLVHLDVSVLDRDRKPVRGLTAKDFVVTEDGNAQDIVAFTAVDVPENPPKPAVWSGRAPSDIQSNEGIEDPEGRLFVVLIDDAMIPQHPGSLETARQVARRFIDKVTPSDRVAVVFSAGSRSQNFTNDRGRLLRAINSLQNGNASFLMGWESAINPATPTEALPYLGPPGPLSDPDIGFRMASMSTLRQVAETLISAPQRRKALVFISAGIPVDQESAAMQTKPGLYSPGGMKDANRQLLKDMPELFHRMQRANVTIYPIDPSGQGGFQGYLLNAALALPALRAGSEEPRGLPAFYDWLDPGAVAPLPDQLVSHVAGLNSDFLETVAKNTGGLALVNTNDYEGGIDRIFLENSSYYLIGYQQPSGQKPGSLHHLKVSVNRPGVTVRTRSGYEVPVVPKAKQLATLNDVSALDKAIAGAVPNGTFPMRVALAPFVVPGHKDPVVTVVLGLAQPAVARRTSYTVDLQTNAYTSDGKPRFVGQRHTASVILVPGTGREGPQYDLLSTISLPPGRYELRMSAHRGLDNVDGSLYAEVEVPDFNAPLAVSGLVVEAVPTGAVAPANAFDAFLPVVPTSSRVFRPGQEVSAFLRIYQGGKGSAQAVEVKTRLVNELDAPVGEGRDIVSGSAFRVGGRAADYRFAIPVKRLPPGPYLLTLDFSLGGDTITRTVQFTVAR